MVSRTTQIIQTQKAQSCREEGLAKYCQISLGRIMDMMFYKQDFNFHYSTAKSRVESNLVSKNLNRGYLKAEEENVTKRGTRLWEQRYANNFIIFF